MSSNTNTLTKEKYKNVFIICSFVVLLFSIICFIVLINNDNDNIIDYVKTIPRQVYDAQTPLTNYVKTIPQIYVVQPVYKQINLIQEGVATARGNQPTSSIHPCASVVVFTFIMPHTNRIMLNCRLRRPSASGAVDRSSDVFICLRTEKKNSSAIIYNRLGLNIPTDTTISINILNTMQPDGSPIPELPKPGDKVSVLIEACWGGWWLEMSNATLVSYE